MWLSMSTATPPTWDMIHLLGSSFGQNGSTRYFGSTSTSEGVWVSLKSSTSGISAPFLSRHRIYVRGFLSSRQFPQHGGHDATVAVVLDVGRGVQPHLDLERRRLAGVTVGVDGHETA